MPAMRARARGHADRHGDGDVEGVISREASRCPRPISLFRGCLSNGIFEERYKRVQIRMGFVLQPIILTETLRREHRRRCATAGLGDLVFVLRRGTITGGGARRRPHFPTFPLRAHRARSRACRVLTRLTTKFRSPLLFLSSMASISSVCNLYSLRRYR